MFFIKYFAAISFFSLAASYTISPNTVPVDLENRSPSGSAGLRWGPYYVGALKLSITNPHTGYAGPKFATAPHINVHVDRKAGSGYKQVVNLYVVKYTKARRQCLYMWDSKSRKTVFDKCFDDFGDAAREAVETAKQVVDTSFPVIHHPHSPPSQPGPGTSSSQKRTNPPAHTAQPLP